MILETSRVGVALALLVLMTGCASDDEPASDAGGGGVGGGSSEPTTGEECFADLEAPAAGWFVEIQRFVADDGSVSVWRARQPGDRSAVGETFPYDLVRAWIDSDDEDGTCVTDPSAFTYTFGHHNWAETWTITTAHATYTGSETIYNAPPDPAEWGWTDTLRATDSGGAELFSVELVEDGCESRPYDLNPCMMRMRVDMPPPGWGEE